ncbi:hypothetical protein KDN34_13695 [Shewanella yunxiaonensis]|uniref:Uncharacterized protein n=1 Tax=Shewanella yunxiaonensis TaxID=2829809 RepID=A0ABX7YRH4_9GAMM|nr:hypothetical protein [Shewanella yunxiaonensis]QUN05242.1 hypothetical protein KDN34_13695 [Shewanella yunxiaonensis]
MDEHRPLAQVWSEQLHDFAKHSLVMAPAINLIKLEQCNVQTLNELATPIPLGAAQVRWAAIEQSRHGCRRSRAEEWSPSWRRFVKMTNHKPVAFCAVGRQGD